MGGPPPQPLERSYVSMYAWLRRVRTSNQHRPLRSTSALNIAQIDVGAMKYGLNATAALGAEGVASDITDVLWYKSDHVGTGSLVDKDIDDIIDVHKHDTEKEGSLLMNEKIQLTAGGQDRAPVCGVEHELAQEPDPWEGRRRVPQHENREATRKADCEHAFQVARQPVVIHGLNVVTGLHADPTDLADVGHSDAAWPATHGQRLRMLRAHRCAQLSVLKTTDCYHGLVPWSGKRVRFEDDGHAGTEVQCAKMVIRGRPRYHEPWTSSKKDTRVEDESLLRQLDEALGDANRVDAWQEGGSEWWWSGKGTGFVEVHLRGSATALFFVCATASPNDHLSPCDHVVRARLGRRSRCSRLLASPSLTHVALRQVTLTRSKTRYKSNVLCSWSTPRHANRIASWQLPAPQVCNAQERGSDPPRTKIQTDTHCIEVTLSETPTKGRTCMWTIVGSTMQVVFADHADPIVVTIKVTKNEDPPAPGTSGTQGGGGGRQGSGGAAPEATGSST
ncbi:hypothetical protein PSPO01_14635 [Paraphaeosphaeria sporulosa]